MATAESKKLFLTFHLTFSVNALEIKLDKYIGNQESRERNTRVCVREKKT